VAAGSSVTFEIVGAQTGQIMPVDTAISAELEEGDIDDAYEVPNSNFNARLGDQLGVDIFTFNIPSDAIGPLTILVETPNGNTTRLDVSF
jgi:hypothetical protein